MKKLYIIKVFYKDLIGCGETIYVSDKNDNIHEFIINNSTDMFEGVYPYAMSGKVELGWYSIIEELQWYQWDKEKSGYIPIDRPKEIMDIQRFMI